MPHLWSVCSPAHFARLTGLALTLGLTACGERVGGAQSDHNAGAAAANVEELDGEGGPARPPMDPCALLTEREISEQLLQTVSPSERANWTTTEFQVVPVEVDWGVSRRCEFRWQSRQQVSGGAPVVRGLFILMVFRSDGLGVPVRDRRPVPGAGPEIFRHKQVFHVTKGDYAVSLTDFKGTPDAGGNEHAGRVTLLHAAAARLP
jgi:hypothetical protein